MVQDKSGSEHYTAFILIYVITYRSEDIKTNHCRTDVFKCAFPSFNMVEYICVLQFSSIKFRN